MTDGRCEGIFRIAPTAGELSHTSTIKQTTMELTLSQRQMDEIVHKLRVALRDDMKKMLKNELPPEMVTTSEAAKMLGITPDRLRHIASTNPNRYPHTKRGDSKQAPLMWVRDALLN